MCRSSMVFCDIASTLIGTLLRGCACLEAVTTICESCSTASPSAGSLCAAASADCAGPIASVARAAPPTSIWKAMKAARLSGLTLAALTNVACVVIELSPAGRFYHAENPDVLVRRAPCAARHIVQHCIIQYCIILTLTRPDSL